MGSNIITFAQYTINHSVFSEKSLSHLKLQKILYYLKVWGLVTETNIFPEHFDKWTHGPTNYLIYQQFKKYGRNPIPKQEVGKSGWTGIPREFADFIIGSYAPYSAIALSAMTHVEDPWLQTKNNHAISADLIRSYYSKQVFAKNFPIDIHSKKYYSVKTDHDAAYALDMSAKAAEAVFVYDSFSEYTKNLYSLKQKTLKHFKKNAFRN